MVCILWWIILMPKPINMRKKCNNNDGYLYWAHMFPRVLGYKRGSDITKVRVCYRPTMHIIGSMYIFTYGERKSSLWPPIIFASHVDRFLDWVPLNKTTHGRLNKCYISYISVIIKLIDRSWWILNGNYVSKTKTKHIFMCFLGIK